MRHAGPDRLDIGDRGRGGQHLRIGMLRRVEDVVTVITAVDGSVTGYTATVTEQNL